MKGNSNPLVSVIIPTYKNRGGLIASIDSAFSQTYKNLEILVVDDNNPDSAEREMTENLMKKYENEKRLVYIKHEKNRNGAAARNTGIKASHGDYIAFLDDDDEWLPQKIEKQLKFITNKPSVSCVYCYAYLGDRKDYVTPFRGNAIIPLLKNRTCMYTPTLLFRRSVIEAIGGFDESFSRHQDYELLIRFFRGGFLIDCLEEYMVRLNSLGGNQLSPRKFVELKNRFLNVFSKEIEEIDKQYPGSKSQIIVSNYVVAFESALAYKDFKCAMQVFCHYFFKNPLAFVSQEIFIMKGRLKKCK